MKLLYTLMFLPLLAQGQAYYAGVPANSGAHLIFADHMTNGTSSDMSSLINVQSGGYNWGYTPALEGSFSLYLTGAVTTAQIKWQFASTYNEAWAAFQFKLVGTPVNNLAFVTAFQTSGGVGQAEIDVNSSTGIMKVRNGGTSSGGTVGTMSVGTLYYVWLHWKNDGTADAEFETTPTRVGSGNNFTSVSGGSGTSTMQRFNPGNAIGASGLDYEFDSIKISDTGYPTFP